MASELRATANGLSLVKRDPAPTVLDSTDRAEEIAWVDASRNGDTAAFDRLYRAFGPMVHGILLARVPYDEVDDLLQDVFLQAFRKLDGLRDSAAFGGWLAMIARNRAMDFHRRKRVTEELNESLPERGSLGTEAAEAIRAIASLPDAYRETLILRLVEGLTGPEIAEQTGLTPASVRVNLHRGMKMLREKLGMG
jgi:RNA polymerase sigma-70 factor, ECF subfamily